MNAAWAASAARSDGASVAGSTSDFPPLSRGPIYNGHARIALRLLPTFDDDQAAAKTTDVTIPVKIGR